MPAPATDVASTSLHSPFRLIQTHPGDRFIPPIAWAEFWACSGYPLEERALKRSNRIERNTLSKLIAHNKNDDGIDLPRLPSIAWHGPSTGIIWAIGRRNTKALAPLWTGKNPAYMNKGGLSFVQTQPQPYRVQQAREDPDVTATLQAAIDKIGALETQPEFLLHTGDLTHGAHPAEFDTLDQMLRGTKRQVYYVPEEHDTFYRSTEKLIWEALRQGHEGVLPGIAYDQERSSLHWSCERDGSRRPCKSRRRSSSHG